MANELHRMTTSYVETEDRVQLAGESADGTATVIWVSRRLLVRLLPLMLQWLEQQGVDPDSVDHPHVDVLHSFAQQAARAELAPQPAVQATGTSSQWLAFAVDVASHPSALRLSFRSAADEQAFFSLTPLPLRQWLNILHDAFVKAEWPLDIWPSWLSEHGKTIPSGVLFFH